MQEPDSRQADISALENMDTERWMGNLHESRLFILNNIA